MTDLEIILSLILYIFMAIFLGYKQYECFEEYYANDNDETALGVMLVAVFWPIALVLYTIRAVFIRKWE